MVKLAPRFMTIDGLRVRIAESETSPHQTGEALLLSPWPESLYAYEPTWMTLSAQARLIGVDLPGFGHSEYSAPLMSPQAMGDFILRMADALDLDCPHIVAPDIGTSATLFAAARHPRRFRSIVVGSGGAAVPLQLSGVLKEWAEARDLAPYRRIDGREVIKRVMSTLERYTPSDAAREDYLSAYAGERFADSMRYVQSYARELPILRDLLATITAPVRVIAGRRDPVVPLSNAAFLTERLPNSDLKLLDAGHFNWEDAADEYADLVIAWWLQTDHDHH